MDQLPQNDHDLIITLHEKVNNLIEKDMETQKQPDETESNKYKISEEELNEIQRRENELKEQRKQRIIKNKELFTEKLKKEAKLKAFSEGKNIVFKDIKSNAPIFQLRVKLRPPPANEAKFYLEVGKGIYKK